MDKSSSSEGIAYYMKLMPISFVAWCTNGDCTEQVKIVILVALKVCFFFLESRKERQLLLWHSEMKKGHFLMQHWQWLVSALFLFSFMLKLKVKEKR